MGSNPTLSANKKREYIKKMIIACLGWGSLIWDPRELPIIPKWHDDGPFAPVEFVRQSNDGRITLVLDEASLPVRLLWSQMTINDIASAKEALKTREGLTGQTWRKNIGVWEKENPSPKLIPNLDTWAEAHGIDAVIWTALGAKFDNDKQKRPSFNEVIEHLESLRGTKLDNAKKYIINTPLQIDTAYRREIKAKLGWA